MAGHSKWANIKHRKAGQDAKRGKLFTKLLREITVSAKQGGGDENSNPRLRNAIDKALDANMAKDNIQRAIKKAIGGDDGQELLEIRYEGYAPGGVAVLVECLTDNKNRTVSEVRHAFSKHGGNLGTDGSVGYLFNQLGQIIVEPGVNEDSVMDIALENEAEDIISQDDGSIEVRCGVNNFAKVKDALKTIDKLSIANAEVTMLAEIEIELDLETSQSVLKLVERLEDLDDVQAVYTNASFDDAAFS